MNKLHEIETELYAARMRLRSVEASFERLEPYSPAFDAMLEKACELKAEIDRLAVARYSAMKRDVFNEN